MIVYSKNSFLSELREKLSKVPNASRERVRTLFESESKRVLVNEHETDKERLQYIFTHCWEALCKQGQASFADLRCQYLTPPTHPNGKTLKCAAGHFILKEDYTVSMELRPIYEETLARALIKRGIWEQEEFSLLYAMQYCHDHFMIAKDQGATTFDDSQSPFENWKLAMRYTAEMWELEVPEVSA